MREQLRKTKERFPFKTLRRIDFKMKRARKNVVKRFQGTMNKIDVSMKRQVKQCKLLKHVPHMPRMNIDTTVAVATSALLGLLNGACLVTVANTVASKVVSSVVLTTIKKRRMEKSMNQARSQPLNYSRHGASQERNNVNEQ